MLLIRVIVTLFMTIGITHADVESYGSSVQKNPYSVLPIEGESKLRHKKRKKGKVLQYEDGHRQLSVSGSPEMSLSDREDEAYQSDGLSMVDESSVEDEVSQGPVGHDPDAGGVSGETCVAPPLSEARGYFVSQLKNLGEKAMLKARAKLNDPVFQQKIVNRLLKQYVQVAGMICSQRGYIGPGAYEEIWFQYNTWEFLNSQFPVKFYE